MPAPCYIVDIDGTVADVTHRLHFIQRAPKDWEAFFSACKDDKPIEHMRLLLRAIQTRYKHEPSSPEIVYVTGRPESTKEDTLDWLCRHDFPIAPIFMREDGDHRLDVLFKKKMLHKLRYLGYEPVLVFEDRARVVKMWRDNGVPCAQVSRGEY